MSNPARNCWDGSLIPDAKTIKRDARERDYISLLESQTEVLSMQFETLKAAAFNLIVRINMNKLRDKDITILRDSSGELSNYGLKMFRELYSEK